MGRDFSKTVFSSEFFIPVSCDVTNISDLQSKIQNIRSKEEVSVLINNAGIGYFGPHEEQNPHKIHQMVVTNLEVPMILTQVLLRDLKKNAGYIINVSSITANKSNTHGCAYGATKAGLSSFSLLSQREGFVISEITLQPQIHQIKRK